MKSMRKEEFDELQLPEKAVIEFTYDGEGCFGRYISRDATHVYIDSVIKDRYNRHYLPYETIKITGVVERKVLV